MKNRTFKRKKLRTQNLDVFRHSNRFDAVGVVRVTNTKGSGFSAFTDQGFTTRDDVLLNEHLAAPLLDAGVYAQPFAIRGGADKAGVDLKQRRADDARGFVQVAPSGYAALDEKIQ